MEFNQLMIFIERADSAYNENFLIADVHFHLSTLISKHSVKQVVRDHWKS